MLKFQVFDNARPAASWPLRNAYLTGSDGSAMRAEITFERGLILCEKRESGTAALSLQYRVGELGELTLQTCLLPDRDEPYLLSMELARHRLMILYTKLEDWGMFELDAEHAVPKRAELGRARFIEALCVQKEDPARAAGLAHECLEAALDGTEELALAHSELLLSRRRSTAALPKYPVGSGVGLDQGNDRLRMVLQSNCDFVQLGIPWKRLAPEEAEYRWELMDNWISWAARNRMTVVAGPLISFEPTDLPDWLYIWEHDYDTVRDLIYEHVERVVNRYKNVVSVWNVVSGLHVNKHFTFNFEQLMDLTRMTTMLVKKLAPGSRSLVEIRQPFGEYYAGNQRSIPPVMYADLVTQSTITFDGFGIRLLMGQALSGQYTRDLMQVSNLLDQYAAFGKPLFLTLAAPSEPVTAMMIATAPGGDPVDDHSGFWRRPWSPLVQSHWLEAVFQLAMSRPFVEAVAWQDLVDHPNIEMPLSGLITEDLQPKAGLRRLAGFRKNLLANPGKGESTGNKSQTSESGLSVTRLGEG
jgi:hypothetical protein